MWDDFEPPRTATPPEETQTWNSTSELHPLGGIGKWQRRGRYADEPLALPFKTSCLTQHVCVR